MENKLNNHFRIYLGKDVVLTTSGSPTMKFTKKKIPRKLKKKLAKKKSDNYNLLDSWQKSGENMQITCSINGVKQDKLSGYAKIKDINIDFIPGNRVDADIKIKKLLRTIKRFII